ncbi:tetratricopeptide (TPR) repeat protein [Hymenobacter luteus]|uniref:Tetratricopeptide (TPR) repeat protein n=2 Tax=Hymenobacter TaxID=89966 RepID=A0A7W9WDF6_9BACT|nr:MULTISPECIES: tetratricopeptide repeat protein [Hymenobacter]MBB4603354.1 tetratricopeptide (TPR) repeat protein [Hymenobacter latericoloratus]MBB6061088.1 tetratricopeptide (TPR) repeat protein [Hymenobacter luteus]
MSKIPFTGKSQQARQQQAQRAVPSADPLQPAEAYNPEHPLLEDPDALAIRLAESEDFVRRNKNVLLGLLAVVVLAVVGGFGYYLWRGSQDSKGQAALFQAVNYWEADSLQKAMKGDGRNLGLERVASEYSGTDAGNLANFYAGVAALKQGQYQQAIDYLEDFSSNDYLVQARAYALLGDAHLELNQAKEAANFYNKAANHNANEYLSPAYLLKEATACELGKDNEGAIAAYDKILADYPASAEATEAKQYKARAEALAGK